VKIDPARLNPSLYRDIGFALLFAAASLALPLNGLSAYMSGQLSLFFLWACVTIQWNLVFGVAGIMSLAQVSVFAFGAYVTAMLATYTGLPFFACFLLSSPAAVVFSLLIGCLTLRMRGEYVAIVTLAITVLFSNLITNDVSCFREVDQICYNFTGGSQGLSGYGDFGWSKILGFKHRLFGDYYLTLTLTLLSLIVSLFVIHGPFGLAFRAIRDNEIYARARGVDFRRIQLIVFALTGVMTGLAGGAYAGVLTTVGPTVLDLDLLVFLLSMIIVGGRGSTWGPLLGGAALMAADSQFQSMGGWRTGALAAITIAFVVIYPRGLAGAIADLVAFVKVLPELRGGRWRPGA
jgi:branched-chain amino acid transport system permease protein